MSPILSIILASLIFIHCDTGVRISAEYDIVIDRIHIIDPVERRIIHDQAILIKDGIIQDIVQTTSLKRTSRDFRAIDGQDGYAISGFWNMHTHLAWKSDLDDWLFPIMLSYGITGARDMGGDLEILNTQKEKIRLQPERGTMIFGPGPILDGENPIHPDFSVALTEENVWVKLDSLLRMKPDFLKVYSLLPEPVLEKIAEFASLKNLTFSGHISEYIAPSKAVQLGQRSIEHLNGIEHLRHDPEKLEEFIKQAIENETYICPTLIIYKTSVDLISGDDLDHPLMHQLDPVLQSEWRSAKEKAILTPETEKQKSIRRYEELKQLVLHLHTAGIPMLTGNDFAGMPYVYPGLGLHHEMSILSGIGIDHFDILKMATFNAAEFLGISRTHGVIRKGMVADLVLLRDNPIENIHNTMSIFEVIRAGKSVKAE